MLHTVLEMGEWIIPFSWDTATIRTRNPNIYEYSIEGQLVEATLITAGSFSYKTSSSSPVSSMYTDVRIAWYHSNTNYNTTISIDQVTAFTISNAGIADTSVAVLPYNSTIDVNVYR